MMRVGLDWISLDFGDACWCIHHLVNSPPPPVNAPFTDGRHMASIKWATSYPRTGWRALWQVCFLQYNR